MAQRDRIGEILLRAKVIDELQLRSALSHQEQWGGRLAKIVVERRLATEEQVTQALSVALRTPVVHLRELAKDAGALARVDVGTAEQQAVFPVQLKDHGRHLVLAMADPTDLQTLDEVAHRCRLRVEPVLASENEIQQAILRHYRGIEPQLSPPQAPSPSESSDPGEGDLQLAGSTGDLASSRTSGVPAPPSPRLSEEELARLAAVQQNQKKSAEALRAVRELLEEKGLLAAAPKGRGSS